jgi:hypothetical protein
LSSGLLIVFERMLSITFVIGSRVLEWRRAVPAFAHFAADIAGLA